MKKCAVKGCDKPAIREMRDYCCAHDARMRRYGTTDSWADRRHKAFPAKFRSLCKMVDNGCIEWQGKRTVKGKRSAGGYGQVSVNGRLLLAHRVAWELAHGPIPVGMFVCHICDNPSCVNVDHLFLGSHTDNMRDAKLKGRLTGPRGSSNRWVKLTETDVLEIRSLRTSGADLKSIADRFGICFQNVSMIANRKTWRHI